MEQSFNSAHGNYMTVMQPNAAPVSAEEPQILMSMMADSIEGSQIQNLTDSQQE